MCGWIRIASGVRSVPDETRVRRWITIVVGPYGSFQTSGRSGSVGFLRQNDPPGAYRPTTATAYGPVSDRTLIAVGAAQSGASSKTGITQSPAFVAALTTES